VHPDIETLQFGEALGDPPADHAILPGVEDPELDAGWFSSS
jgi:hypothetical protein